MCDHPASLQSSLELASLIMSATQDGVMDWNLETDTVAYDGRWKCLLGHDPDALHDTRDLWRTLSHPRDLPGVEAALKDSLEGDWPFNHTWRMRHHNGEWRWLQCRAASTHGPTGRVTRWVGVFSDVSEVLKLRFRQQAILGAVTDGIIGFDATGRVSFVNPAAARMLEQAPAELVSVPLRALGLGADPRVLGAALERVVADVAVVALPDLVCPSVASGRARVLDGVMAPIVEDGQADGAVLSLRDVTQQRRLEAQAFTARKLESLGQLAAGIAHEVNTPIQYIGDNLHFLAGAWRDLAAAHETLAAASTAASPALGEFVVALRQSADLEYLTGDAPVAIARSLEGVARVAKIVSAMKSFSHPGPDTMQPADLNLAIESTIVVATSAWRDVAELESDLDPALGSVRCQIGEINQVVLNLLVNAAHALEDRARRGGPARGVIRVSTRRTGSAVEIRVRDTGGGIPEAARARVFDPFFTTKDVGRGTGQGLALAYAVIVEHHHGSITFETEIDRGTEFVVTLPITQQRSVAGVAEA